MIRRLLSIVLLSAVGLMSCSRSVHPAQMLEDARIEVSDSEFNSARDILDRLTADSAAFGSLTVEQLVSAAELYTILAYEAPDTNTETDQASAARCLARAHQIDPDSISYYINRLSPDAAFHLRTLSSVSVYLGVPRDSLLVGEEPDSVM